MTNRQTRQPCIPPDPATLTVPLYIRIPSSGARCPYCGLSRSTLDLLTRPQAENGYKPAVKSKLWKQSGAIAKVRLIDFASLRAYLNSLPDGQQHINQKQETAPKP
jgi:hypothetical protein